MAKLIRFSPKELASITSRARQCGQTPARFIREAALGAIPRGRRRFDATTQLRELARIGRDLDALNRALRPGVEQSEASAQSAADFSIDSTLLSRLNAALDAHCEAIRALVNRRTGRSRSLADTSESHGLAGKVAQKSTRSRQAKHSQSDGPNGAIPTIQGSLW